MDITSSLHQRMALPVQGAGGTRRPHKRSSSFSAGLLSFMSTPSPPPSVQNLTSTSTPSLLSPSQSWSPAHRPRTSSGSIFSAISSPGLNGSGVVEEEEVDPEVPLPTFEVPQVMLAVDLSLGPGESRTCKSHPYHYFNYYHPKIYLIVDTYTLPLPDNLPPTFKGRSLKFSYQFVVGTCRAGSSPHSPTGVGKSGSSGANSVSRVMKVPIRVYNNVFGEHFSL